MKRLTRCSAREVLAIHVEERGSGNGWINDIWEMREVEMDFVQRRREAFERRCRPILTLRMDD